ncbi:hypothetical protein T484DRAFT_1896130, partial [Baffinella frigidus]
MRTHAEKVFVAWSMLSLASRRREAIATRLAERWRRAHLFSAWLAIGAEAKRNSALANNRRNSALSSAFRRWCDGAGQQARLRTRLEKAVGRWRTGGLGKAMVAWEANAAEAKRSRKVLQRVVGRWGTGVLAKALLAWETNSSESKRLRDVAERVRRSWLLSHHRKALAGWSFAVNSRVELRGKLTNVLAWWRNATLADAWWTWNERVQTQQLQRERGESEQLTAQLQREREERHGLSERAESALGMVRAAMSKGRADEARRRMLFSVFSQWRAWVLRTKVLGNSSARLFVRSRRLLLVAGWAQWEDAVAESKEDSKEEGSLARTWVEKERADRADALVKMLQGKQARRQEYLQLFFGRASARMQQETTQLCIALWAEATREEVRLRVVGAKVVGRWCHQSAGMALTCWAEAVARARTQRLECMSRTWEEWSNVARGQATRRRNMTRAVSRWQRGCVVRMWEAWVAELESARFEADELRKQAMLEASVYGNQNWKTQKKAAALLLHRTSAKALFAWRGACDDIKRMRIVGAK